MIKNFRNFNIGTKINVLVGITLILICIVMGFGIRQNMIVGEELISVVEVDEPILEILSNIANYHLAQRVYLERAIPIGKSIAQDKTARNRFYKERDKFLKDEIIIEDEIKKGQSLLAEAYKRYKTLEKGKSIQEIHYDLRSIQRMHSNYQFQAVRIFNLLLRGKVNKADTVINTIMFGDGEKELKRAHQNFLLSIKKFIEGSKANARKTEKEAILFMTLASSLIFIFSLVFGIFITRSIAKPIQDLEKTVKEIGEGKLDAHVSFESKDEIGSLASSFNKMTEDLKKTTVSKDYVDSIIKSLMDMLIILNPDGTIRTVNNTTLKTLGYIEQELINESITDLIAAAEEEEEEEEVFRDIAKFNTLVQEGLIKEFRAFVKAKSGERIPVIITSSVLRDKQQRLIGVILSLKDARDSKLIKELKDTQYQLIQSGKLAALGEMSSGLAHEINNPLFLIKGFNNRIKAELSKYSKDSYEQVRDYVCEVNENSQRIMKIVNHFKEFSRQEEHDFTPISIDDVVSKSFILLNEQFRLRAVNIKQNLTLEDTKIMGNDNQLEQVFINLITNARDAIEQAHGTKGGDLVVCTRREGKSAIVEISDNGIGVDDEQLKRIFDPFFTTKEVGKGTGLGLSISHGIVADHKGQINCRSKRGEGSSFIVTFPMYENKENMKV